ncbi:MAG: DUF4372 domain-containing protein [Phycisphaeraceae bacterium]|nr:DUF4372 domain-containing protein [Phycisphaeraceae bacterium]
MNAGRTLFSQLVDFLPRDDFYQCVQRYHGHYKIKTFSCFDQYLCMAFAQLTGRESLRDIEVCLKTFGQKLYHAGFRSKQISRNTLANANHIRPWQIYADFAQTLIAKATDLYVDTDLGFDLDNTIYALDSTTIDLCLSIFPWANFRKTKAAVKMHTLLNLKGSIPEFIYISEGSVHDVNILDDLPILSGVDEALKQLEQTLVDVCEAFDPGAYQVACQATSELERPHLQQVTEHVWLSTFSNAKTGFILSESGKAMALDYGYNWDGIRMQTYPYPERRRALLHGLDELQKRFGIDRIDMVLVSHFHDDHVSGIPVLQRLFGTECWATENFADLLEHPEAHCFPCNWPRPIEVHRRIAMDETVQWEEYNFHFASMTGHTRFASLLGFEADGKRFAHTGDQVFFRQEDEPDFSNSRQQHNHVYRNGALLDGLAQSSQWLLDWKPEIVLTGHASATRTDEHYFRVVEEGAQEYERLHKLVMPLGEDETHFNVDSWGGWIWPYRVHLSEPQQTTVTVTVRNPLPRQAKLNVKIVGPADWQGSEAVIDALPRAEASCQLSITPTGYCRSQPFVVELSVDGQPFGQVAEALMIVGPNQL